MLNNKKSARLSKLPDFKSCAKHILSNKKIKEKQKKNQVAVMFRQKMHDYDMPTSFFFFFFMYYVRKLTTYWKKWGLKAMKPMEFFLFLLVFIL